MYLVAMGVFCSLMIQAKDEMYLQKMQQSIEQLNSSTTVEDYQANANAFERISKVEADQWQPMYYAAYRYILTSLFIPIPDNG